MAQTFQFRVLTDPKTRGYARISIDGLQFSQGKTIQPPPLNDPQLGVRPSATAAAFVKPAGAEGANQVPGRSWSGWYVAVADALNKLTPVRFEAPSIDESDVNWWGEGAIDADTDPVTFTPSFTGTSVFGRTFAVGDYIMWTTYPYEIDKIIAISGTDYTLQRAQRGSPGTAAFGTNKGAQSGRFYRMIDEIWLELVDPTVNSSILRHLWDNMCVAAVLGSVPSGNKNETYLVQLTTPDAPGLRTLDGAEYALYTADEPAIANSVSQQIQVAGPSTLRCIQAFADACTAELTIEVYFRNGTTYSDVSTIATLVIPVAAGLCYSFSSGDQPQDRQTPYSGVWPFTLFSNNIWENGGLIDFKVISGSGSNVRVMVQT